MTIECNYCHKPAYAHGLCHGCRNLVKKYGSVYPAHWEKECPDCKKIFFGKYHNRKKCSDCLNEERKKKKLESYRKKTGIYISVPRMKGKAGTGSIDKNGYKVLHKIGHPNSMGDKGKILEHTFVMSNHLGRPLRKGENVHHKNGIRDDNRIENLELWHRGQPPGQRVEDKIAWAKWFLSEYNYEVIKKEG